MTDASDIARRVAALADEAEKAGRANVAAELRNAAQRIADQQRADEIMAIQDELLAEAPGPVSGMAAESFYYRAVRIWEERRAPTGPQN